MNDQNMMKKVVLLCLFTVFAVGYALSAGNDDVEKKIDQLLSKMTLEEKIGQINQQTGQGYSPEMVQIVKAGGIGSILNEVDPVVVNKLQKEAMKNSRLHIPLIFARDVIHGFKTIFPIPLGQAASWNLALIEQGARIALSCRKSGRGDGARISDRRPVTAKHYGCLHKALCRLRCGRGWQRL